MSTRSPYDEPGSPSRVPPEGTTFDFSPPGFLLRDPVAVAEQAALGAGGAAQVTGTQDFFRDVLELIEDETWLSGILQFKPVRVTPPSADASFIGYNPNPNAAVPAPETAMRVMTGQAEFHYMWQHQRRP